MKSILTILAVLTLCLTAQAQNPQLYGVVGGAMVTDRNFDQFKGGIQLGTAIPLDNDKGLILRTMYTKAEFGEENLEAIRISPLLTWYAGKKWNLYVVLGGDAPLNDAEGAYFVGLGFSRKVYTGNTTDWLVPFTVEAYADLTTADVQGTDSNTNQLNFGLQFSKPMKR